MAHRDIFVIGASAGGVGALTTLCAAIPADFPASLFIALHLSPSSRSVLPQLLDRVCALPVLAPVDEQPFEPGHVYVASPDHHLLLREGRVLLRRGPQENRTRPAINALFRSAALAYGSRVVGVVLTGLLDDGTEGLIAITAGGGTSVVQSPDDAEWPAMPRNALNRDHVKHVVPLADMAALLSRLATEEAGPTIPLPEEYRIEDLIAAREFAVTDTDLQTPGHASPISCPDCGGVLNQIGEGEEPRFRCQVGHAFTPLGLADAQNAELERALGVAVRTHRDRIRLFTQMLDSARARGLSHAADRWEKAQAESEEMLSVLERATEALRKPPVESEIG